MATPFHPKNAWYSLVKAYTHKFLYHWCHAHALLVFHLSLLAPTHFLYLDYHAHALLVSHWSRHAPTHFYISCSQFVHFIYVRMYQLGSMPWMQYITVCHILSKVEMYNSSLSFGTHVYTYFWDKLLKSAVHCNKVSLKAQLHLSFGHYN